MPEDVNILTAKQKRALAELLQCKSLSEAAMKANVNEKTLSRWVHQDDNFRQAYQDATNRSLDESIARLNKAAGTAVSTLVELMTDPDCGKMIKLNAARAVLEFAFKGRELQVIDKLNTLENLLKNGTDDSDEVKRFENN